MEYLINKLFPEDQSKAFKKLWNNDPDSRNILEQEIAKELIKTENIILEMPLHQLMLIMSLSRFANGPDECYEVAEIIYWGIRQKNIIPLITEHHGKELANRCLITLGLFKKYMFNRWQRRAAPHPDFIRDVGIATYHKLGQDQIGDHFSSGNYFWQRCWRLNGTIYALTYSMESVLQNLIRERTRWSHEISCQKKHSGFMRYLIITATACLIARYYPLIAIILF